MALQDIETIIFVMMENRSFDHMLGYLSLDDTPNKMAVDGLRSDPQWQASYANVANGGTFPLRRLPPLHPVKEDPPHGQVRIKTQIDTPPAGPGPTKMGGFVKTFVEAHPASTDPGVVMGYYDAATLPTYDFFARNFCVCDKWFTPLPLGTQANRLMAMAGESKVVDNVVPLPDQKLVYDWLKEKGIGWRVYVSGGFAPFFLMMKRWALPIARSIALGDGAFRRYGKFRDHWASDAQLPPVIFIEPEYEDAPGSKPNDDHPPAPATRGQAFLNDIYRTVVSNKARWAKTLMIVTYDEHGGFFDHVAPPAIAGQAGGVAFATTGPRVPAFLISPHVEAGQVFSETLDHTAFLTLLDERFNGGAGYSPAVTQRQSKFGRLSRALRATARAGAAPKLAAPTEFKVLASASEAAGTPRAPDTPNAAGLDAMARELREEHPELFNKEGWREMDRYLDENTPPVPKNQDHIGDGAGKKKGSGSGAPRSGPA
jgi:phospholipase C